MTKDFYGIAEVADRLRVEPHVLRFWEGCFSQVAPRKRRGRRLYSEHDINVLLLIRRLLYEEGYTIKGVRKKLSESRGKDPKLLSDGVTDSDRCAGDNESVMDERGLFLVEEAMCTLASIKEQHVTEIDSHPE